jgi:release factor glutamine methyltransferase
VLIPRPETEELVNLIIRENQYRKGLHIMDIGTGSGCIPVALAKNLSTEKVYGVDISEEALKIAAQNAEKYKMTIEWLQADILTDALPIAPTSLDILVSNPPYVLENEKELMRPNVLQYEPHLALFVPDTDALRFYKCIADVALELLKPGGSLYFEINEQFAAETMQMLQQKGFQKTAIISDIFDKERFVKAQKAFV